MTTIGIVVGTTRPGRKAAAVAEWVAGQAQTRDDARFEVVDIADYRLPLLDEPMPPAMGRYQQPHTRAWAERVATYDGFVFVTPEYNHGVPGSLKNALDFVYAEWNNKAAGIVSYGLAGGVRAAEQLRLVLAELQVASVRWQVSLSLFHDFAQMSEFTPGPQHERSLQGLFDQVVSWSVALRPVRVNRSNGAS